MWTSLTGGLLTDPGRLWPWFSLGLASICAYVIASLEIQDGSIGSALVFAALAGVPLAATGWWVRSLGYTVPGWACLAGAALLAMAVIVRCILAAWSRSSNP